MKKSYIQPTATSTALHLEESILLNRSLGVKPSEKPGTGSWSQEMEQPYDEANGTELWK